MQLQAKNQKISIHQFSIVLKIDFVFPFILIPQYNIFPNFCQFSKYESIFDHYAAKDAEQVFIPSKNLTSSLFKFDDTLAWCKKSENFLERFWGNAAEKWIMYNQKSWRTDKQIKHFSYSTSYVILVFHRPSIVFSSKFKLTFL